MLFAGTPAFARASLKALVDSGTRPVAVLTQPDRRSGRGRKARPSPVKAYALEESLPLLQPKTLRDEAAQASLRDLEPDVLIVAAYGLILPQAVLDIPVHGCLNVHASVLPRHRGAAPIQAAILAGDETTGISLMQMEAGLDTGPVFVTADIAIGAMETAGELHDRLAVLGGELLAARLDDILSGRLAAVAQDEALASYAGKINRDDARLDWRRPTVELDRAIRAFNPVPGAFTEVLGEDLKIWQARPAEASGPPGTVLNATRDGLVVATGDAALELLTVQRPGKGRVTGVEYASQRPLDGVRFGSSS